jgi:hypothetical protein
VAATADTPNVGSEERETENWIAVGGPVDASRVCLGIYGDALEPEELTRKLGLAPTHAHRIGDPIDSARVANAYKTGAWILDLGDVDAQDPEDAILHLLQWLPTDGAIWQGLTSGLDVKIGLSLILREWNRGFSLSANTLERLASLRVRLDVELWHMPNPDEVM